MLYSLIETAKANDCEPYEYLEYVLREVPKLKTTMVIFFLGTCQKRTSLPSPNSVQNDIGSHINMNASDNMLA
ncbi:transposase domain-containing protein [Vibrio pomeroyi]|uniref:Transposase domain-containing protein n=1 Tax=Vibrio pomeroyi TaxID=198832 RepID=A0ABV4N5E5_9VIBR